MGQSKLAHYSPVEMTYLILHSVQILHKQRCRTEVLEIPLFLSNSDSLGDSLSF